MCIRKLAAICTALALVLGLTIAVVMTTASERALPQQLTGTAAGRPHRVPSSVTLGRIVNGKVMPAAFQRVRGPQTSAEAKLVPGAVPPAARPRPLRLPARGKMSAEQARTIKGPALAAKKGYDPKTSRELPLSRADQVVYQNTDGTRTAFEFAGPVNYRRPDGAWTPAITTLVPDAAAPSPGASLTPPSAQPGPSAVPPAAGWAEKSEAQPETFAPYANAADLVSLPLGGGHTVSFGIAGAAPVPGSARGSTVSYAGAVPGAAFDFTAGTGLVKEQIVLGSPDVPSTWVFPLDLTGLRAKQGPGGIVEFADASGKVLGYVPHGFMADSDINPHSGDGAMSTGVSYSVVTVGGRQAIRMTLDTAWLDSKARVYPVTVDPSVTSVNANGTTYVQYPFTNDYSGDTEIHAGTYDGGSDKAKAFLAVGNVASQLKNDTVLGVRLGVFNTWSYSCSPRAVYVYPVTSSWSVTGNKSWPGPSTGGAVGRKSFAAGWVPYGSSTSPCPASWEGINLDQAGTNLVNGWTHGSVADNGLALGASDSDSYGWKKFASDTPAGGSGDPFLAVTYTTDGASYSLASHRPVTPVTPSQNGEFAIKVTNTGSSTWTTSNGYEMSYRAYNSKNQLVADHKVFTAMPSTVAPGQTVTVDVTVDSLAAGSYAIDFDMYSGAPGSPVSFFSQGIPPYAIGLYVPEPPPVVTAVYPPTGYISPTLRQQLSTTAAATGTITYSFKLTCEPLTGQTCVASTVSSGTISKPYWTPPAASLQWNTQYQWSVTVTGTSGTSSTSTTVGPVDIIAEVPQPNITSGLGGSSGQTYDPLSGNYTTSAIDAAVASIGPPLRIVRTYNSMDPRTTGAFGAGWSSVLDTALRPDNDGSGGVVVALPSGQQMRFGQNGDGTYAPPFGSNDVLMHNSSGTWTLRGASGDQYAFTSGGLLTQITGADGFTQQFTVNSSGEVTAVTNPVSGRTLTVAWSTPSGAAHPHVASVTTQGPAVGQAGYTWGYAYTGDELTSACAPATTGTGCTTYSYSSGSHYLAGVLDSGPRSYWQFGDAASGTTATDEVDANLGTANGTYHNVTLGAAGPLAGSSETTASFNGTSSYVSLPDDLLTDSTDVSIGLWFKAAPGTSGVLFAYSAGTLASGSEGDHAVPALYIGANGELYGEIYAGSATSAPHSSASVNDGQWHYTVLSASSSSQSLYLDGVEQGTLAGQVNPLNMVHDSVGAGFWGSGWPEAGTANTIGYFTGDIGQVAVYPHPLGQPAISAQYALATAASPELNQATLPSGKVYEQASYGTGTGRLASYTDPDGGQWTIGQPLATGYKASSDALGEVVDQVTVTDPASRQETYSYDMLDGGRLVGYDNGADPVEAYGYDAAGFLTSVVDQDGNLVCFTNDVHGDVLARTWYPAEPATLPGIGTGAASSCGGSSSSSPACTTSGAPCTTFYGYTTYNTANPLDPTNGKLTSVRDGRSASASDNTYETTYSYNTIGQLILETTPATSDFPNGRTTRYVYSTGTETAANGGTIPAGLLESVTTPGGAKTTYQYDSNGDLAQVTEPSGRYTGYTYDALGRPRTSTVYTSSLPSGEGTSYSYDALGDPLTVTYPEVTNQVTHVTHTLEDTYAYDDDGDLSSLTQSDTTGGDPSRTTSYTYNDHDQVETWTQPAGATPGGGTAPPEGAPSANPQGATTGYDYDGFGNVTQVTDPNGNQRRYSYNEYNEPTQVELYTPSTSEAAPTANCAAPATQDADGGCDLVLDSYAYDPAGLLAATTDAMGRITNYTYDHDQDLIAATTTDPSTSPSTGRQARYVYDGAGNLVGRAVSAMSGGAVGTTTYTNYAIDAVGRLTSAVRDATPSGSSGGGYLNRTVSYTYDADNHVLSQTVGTSGQGGPSVTDYTYDTAGDQTSQTAQDGSSGLETTWTYDQNGLPLSMTTPAGNASGATAANYTTSYAYDPAGNLITTTGPPVQAQTYAAQIPANARPVTTYGYDTYGDKTQVQDPNGNVTVTGYDGDGRVTSIAQPSYTPPGSTAAITATAGYAYDENGNLVQVTDPAGNVTKYSYDALGDVASMTGPQLPGQSAPGTWAYAYDADGEQLSATDPLGNASHATYDYFGQQATSTDALGNTTKYAYDYLGDQTQVTTPDGAVTTNTYDHLGELTSAADAYGDTSSYQYDYAGRLAYAYNPDGSFAQYGYDEAGNPTSVTDWSAAPAGQASAELRSASFGYDPNGDLTSAKDWDGNTTNYAYNGAGELTSQVRPVSSSASITTSYGYDPAGNQTAVTDGNGNTTWTTYNPWNLPESVIEPATAAASAAADRMWTTAYNPDGQAATVTQPGGITQSYSYDPLGDVAAEAGSGASAATAPRSFGYDLDGRMTSASAPGGTDSFSYNADSQLTGSSGPSGTSSYAYNGDGLVSSETDAAGTTGYTYDSADRLATETEPLTGATLSYSYNADSLPTSIGYASGGAAGPVRAFKYDSLNRLTSDTVTSASGAALASETYGYDADGSLTSQATGGLMGAASTSYGYDQASRLISATTSGTTASYAYDKDGNLTQSGAASYAYNAQDQLTSSTAASGTTSYGYTLSGALASVTPPGGSAQGYTADAFGQQVTMPGGISYGYDALGRAVARGTGSGSVSMSYLGTGTTLASDGHSDYSYTPSGAMTATQVPGATGYVTMSDQHGDVAATFSPTSTATGLAGYATYSPYGVQSASGYKPGIGFQGDYTDPATGLALMGARWYNPATGSFVTNDQANGSPLSSTIDDNPYTYTNGNPLTRTDPTGHWASSCGGIPIDGVIAVGGCVVGVQGGSSTGSQGGIQFGISTQYYQSHYQSQSQGQVTEGYQMFPGSIDWAALVQEWLGTSGGGSSGRGSCTDNCGGGYGGYGGCVYDCGYTPPPPPPPPPPQDCYAGPNPTCTPPQAPGSLRNQMLITDPVRDTTSFNQLAREHRVVIETPTERLTKVSGLQPSSTTNGEQGNNGDNNNIQRLTQPVQLQQPALPIPPDPGNNKNIQKLAKQAAQAATPVAQTLLRPVFEDAQSIISNGVSCITHPQLGSCLQTLATALPFAFGSFARSLFTAGEDDGNILESAEGCFGGASFGGASFTASTMVLLASGKAVPISQLKAGDKVLATNTKTGKTQAETVTAVEVRHDRDLYDLRVKTSHGTAVIHTTSNHLFWDPYLHYWVSANKLSRNEHLKAPDGQVVTADGGITPKQHDGWMWDLTVPGNNDHDFYVLPARPEGSGVRGSYNQMAGAAPVLVHNDSCEPNEIPPLRQQYVQEVNGLKKLGETLQDYGASDEVTARTLHAMRRIIGVEYKGLTPPGLLDEIYARNLDKYGDPLGPTIPYLLERGRSWQDIIESASRTGGRDLGF